MGLRAHLTAAWSSFEYIFSTDRKIPRSTELSTWVLVDNEGSVFRNLAVPE
jgi:hypothetical protein